LPRKNHAPEIGVNAIDMYAKAFLFNPDPITVSTLDGGVYVEVNDAFCSNMEYKREEVIGRSAEEIGIWAWSNDRGQVIDDIWEKGAQHNLEMQFVSKSGHVMTGLLSIDIIEVAGQAYLLSIIKDITERKNLEQAMISLEERFYKAFYASPIGMCISTAEEGMCIGINDSFCQMTGYSRRELLGEKLPALKIWGDPAQRFLVKDALIRGKSICESEARFRQKSGAMRLGLYSAEMIDVDGQACILSILVDMTERKQMEREIARLDQLNLVGQLAVNIGHEIRNPMTTVRGYLQLLRGQHKYREEYEVMDLMIEEIDRSDAIISEFISLAHDKHVQLKPTDLNIAITNLLPLLQSTAHIQEKHIKVDLETLPQLWVDEQEMRQMIINLAQNGLEAMPPGGTLRISTSIQGGEVVLAVDDEGCGMSDEVRDKLGMPFFTTKDDRPGLGMAVCFGIARRHNAIIRCISDSAGTTVKVIFPTDT